MLNMYKYLFFKFYTWSINKFGSDDLPTLNALLLISLFQVINIATITFFIEKFMGIVLFSLITQNKGIEILLMLTILILNYFLFIFRGKDDKIISIFQNKPKAVVKRYSLFSVSYGILSLSLLLMVIFCLIK